VTIIEDFPPETQSAARIMMNHLGPRFGSRGVNDLERFLRHEGAGLSNQGIPAIADRDR
jgi:hypothetical protein